MPQKKLELDNKQMSMLNFIRNTDENNNTVNQINNTPDLADNLDEEIFFATPLFYDVSFHLND